MSKQCDYCRGQGSNRVSYWSMLKGKMSEATVEKCMPCNGTGQLSDGYKDWYDRYKEQEREDDDY